MEFIGRWVVKLEGEFEFDASSWRHGKKSMLPKRIALCYGFLELEWHAMDDFCFDDNEMIFQELSMKVEPRCWIK